MRTTAQMARCGSKAVARSLGWWRRSNHRNSGRLI
jgi:hypothetical protein